MEVRGILTTRSQTIINKNIVSIDVNLDSISSSLAPITANHDSFDELLKKLNKETIDHSKYQTRLSSPKQEDINYHLMAEIWDYIKLWGKKYLYVDLGDSCSISALESLKYDAAGLFWFSENGECKIEIKKSIMKDTSYFLVVLVHEYMHYVHFKTVSRKAYYNCPLIFSEGFAEHSSRIFHEQSEYHLPEDLKKSWNQYYELGRLVVSQICSEGFKLSGFVQSFLKNTLNANSWSKLDPLFQYNLA